MVSYRRLTKTLLRLRPAKDQLNKRAIRRFAKNVYMISRLKRQAILCCDDFVTTDQEQYRRFRMHGYLAYDRVRNLRGADTSSDWHSVRFSVSKSAGGGNHR